MKKARKALSFLLCLVLIVGILPVSVLADGTEKPVLDVSRSKTATALTSDWTSEVTLSLPSAEEKLDSDIVFVLDKSESGSETKKKAIDLLDNIYTNLFDGENKVNGTVRVGVVNYAGIAEISSDFVDISTASGLENAKTAVSAKPQGQNGHWHGTNMHAGLLAAKELLEKSTAPEKRRYLILVGDGVTYLYCHDNDYQTAWTRAYDANDCGMLQALSTQYGDSAFHSCPQNDFSIWYQNICTRMQDGTSDSADTYDYITTYPTQENYPMPAESGKQVLPKKTLISNVEKSLYLTAHLYQELAEKYSCYSVWNGRYGEGASTQYLWAVAFMNYLAEQSNGGNVSTAFTAIKNDILYAVGAGSQVVDTMGEKFDFGGLKTMTLTVGDDTLTGTINNDTITFAHNGNDNAYVIVYNKATDSFTWTINENVSNFAPVKLTYTVKLTKPETTEGTYGVTDLDGNQYEDATNEAYDPDDALYTNESTVLTPKDSAGNTGAGLPFPKPSVSYSVDSSGNPILPIVGSLPILWLNMEDHYSYIVGYPDGTVQPNGKITRAEVATIFFRLLSDDTREAFWSTTNDYSDVTADKWYNNAVSTLSRLGVISGYPDGTFRPDASITRAEFAKIAVSFCKYGSTTYSGCFSDVKASDWFSTCVETAKTSNLIAGYPDGTFRPNNAITRAEACTIVNRTLGRKPAKNHMNISGRINWPDCVDTDWFYADIMEATNSHDYQMVGLVEDWNRKLPQRDWAALETEWSHAYSAPGGEVGR